MALRTLSELKSRLFKRTGLDADDQDHIDFVEQAINDSYEDILSRKPWTFLRKEGFFATVAPYSTGTITTSGTTVTGTGTTFTNSMEGRYIHIEGLGDEAHLISTYNSPTSLTLVTEPSADVTASTYSIYQSDYTLADGVDEKSLEYIVDMNRSVRLYPRDHVESEVVYPNQGSLNEGIAEDFSFVGRSSATQVTIRLRPIPNDVRGYRYVAQDTITSLSADNDTPTIPERFQRAIEEGARKDIFAWIGKEKMAEKHEAKYEAIIAEMKRWDKGMSMHSFRFKDNLESMEARGLRLPPNFPRVKF